MKKLLAIAVLGLAAVSTWAQSVVDFRNGGTITFTTAADRFVYKGTVGGEKLTGTNYVAALFYAPGADASLANATQAGPLGNFRVSTTTSPGLWLNNTAYGNNRTLDGIALGATATLQIRVWDITKFATYADALAGGGETGASAAFNWRDLQSNPASPTDKYMDNLRAFAVTAVPEPSTIALGVLGAASLLALRRRK